MDKCHIFVTLLIIKATQLAFFSLTYCRLGQSNNYDKTLVSIKGTDRVIIRQYFVNNVTLRVWYLFSTVRCPQNPSTHYLMVLLPIIALTYSVSKRFYLILPFNSAINIYQYPQTPMNVSSSEPVEYINSSSLTKHRPPAIMLPSRINHDI